MGFSLEKSVADPISVNGDGHLPFPLWKFVFASFRIQRREWIPNESPLKYHSIFQMF
jgi:hypothetical protein